MPTTHTRADGSDETKAKMSAAGLGRVCSDETKAKMSAAAKVAYKQRCRQSDGRFR